MCVAVSWMVGCGGAGDEAHDRQPDPQQQAGEEPGDAVAPMLDSKEP
jgi:hypothetical protein